MSAILDAAARLDPIRRADLARSDAAAGYVQSKCVLCTVSGGDRPPQACRDCDICRSLAAVFARANNN